MLLITSAHFEYVCLMRARCQDEAGSSGWTAMIHYSATSVPRRHRACLARDQSLAFHAPWARPSNSNLKFQNFSQNYLPTSSFQEGKTQQCRGRRDKWIGRGAISVFTIGPFETVPFDLQRNLA